MESRYFGLNCSLIIDAQNLIYVKYLVDCLKVIYTNCTFQESVISRKALSNGIILPKSTWYWESEG